MRAMDFEPFSFRINDNAIPELLEGDKPETKKPGRPEEEKFDPYRHFTEQDVYKRQLLTTHAGRRTFICNALALGTPAQVVMKWTGHSDYKAMKPYIDIADDIKANAMNKFNQL